MGKGDKMVEKDKTALAACSGMSPYGLVGRAACSDKVEEEDNVISICITATSADRAGFQELIRKYPIVAVNGCENKCVDKILQNKGVKVSRSINIMDPLKKEDLEPGQVSRLGDKGEKCVKVVRKEIKKLMDEI